MTLSSRIVLTCVIIVGGVMLVRHGQTALSPALPENMPASAAFVPSGYDLGHNEKTGEWIACRDDIEQGVDQCRVTDSHGSVIYQGKFLPLNGSHPVPSEQLTVATGKSNMWIEGPSEGGPVPVIPLMNGTMLVPSDDSYALAARWSKNPEELQRLTED